MRLFRWIEDQVAAAVERGTARGARNVGLIDVQSDDDAAARELAAVLSPDRLLPPKAATEGKGRGR